MTVRVDECHSFGLYKKGSASVQYKPKFYINNKLVPPIEYDEPFTYLGCHFDFKMSDSKHKDQLLNQLENIDKLPLHPLNKLLLYQRYALSKISWHMTVTNISNTWVKQNIDNIVSKYTLLWLEIPISGTLNISINASYAMPSNILK